MTPATAVNQNQPTLEVRGLAVHYGPIRALDGVSLEFRAGEIHALLGENGAGKSTLGLVVAGLRKATAGTVRLDGVDLATGEPGVARARGVRLVHQELTQCPTRTVAENLLLHRLPANRWGLVDRRAMAREAREVLGAFAPEIDPDRADATLSPGERQRCLIAGALHHDPARPARVLILDEATSALSSSEAAVLLTKLREAAARGAAVIYVTHRLEEVFACAGRVSVLRDGRLVASGPVGEFTESSLVCAMVGRAVQAAAAPPASRSSEAIPALEVRVTVPPRGPDPIELRVAPGEIVGLAGLVGAGRSELLRAIAGLDPRARGTVRVHGREVRPGSAAAADAGIGFVPEDRHREGLFPRMSSWENVSLPWLERLSTGLGIRRARVERAEVHERVGGLLSRAPSLDEPPGALSGGNQQKLLMARVLGSGLRVALLDEPTRGIDVAAKADVHALIRRLASEGCAIVLASSDMTELLALSHRVVVLRQGTIAGELGPSSISQEAILRLATGLGQHSP